ncbi:MAG: hypothetical protein IMZ61_15180 [Planctomycetes bacterium]|nr:hypothetical protein [Planctomycetota bacterium]
MHARLETRLAVAGKQTKGFIVQRPASRRAARDGWKMIDLGLPAVGDPKSIDQEIYERLRMEGEILEKVASLVILAGHKRALFKVARLGFDQPALPGQSKKTRRNQACQFERLGRWDFLRCAQGAFWSWRSGK